MLLSKIFVRSNKNIVLSSLQRFQYPICSNAVSKSSVSQYKIQSRPLSFGIFGSKKKISPESYKVLDKVPQDFDLVYRCTMERYFYGAQIACSIVIAVVLITVATSLDEPVYEFSQQEVEEVKLDNAEDQIYYFTLGLVALNAALLYIVTKFPLRVYFNERAKHYVAISLKGLPLQTGKSTFGVAELRSKGYGILPWKEFTYKTRSGQTVILLDQYFRRPYDMNVMLGYTKLDTE